MSLPTFPTVLLALPAVAMLLACSSATPSMRTVESVDIERFMGDWYVIANIPTRFERGAHNAVESYQLTPEGTVQTTFTYRKGSYDGELKTMKPKGFIRDDGSNAIWGMQFVWPFKAEYLIVYLDEDYSTTIIGRSKRDYLWIMARTPEISDEQYRRLVEFCAEQGYDVEKIQRVPQRWTEPRGALEAP
jgi:apolipoprotein D and lipocalin family protein